MAGTLTKEESETLCKELNNVQLIALIKTLLDMPEDVEAKTLAKTLGCLETKAIFDSLAITMAEAYTETLIIIGRLQSRRLRASSSHNDPVPNQTACPGQSCCLCLPKGVECI